MAIRDDLIRRRDAIESVAGLADTMSVCVSTDECRGMMRMKMCALSAINEVPAAAPRGEEADGERENAWVSVKDALPDNHTDCLVYCGDDYGIMISHYCYGFYTYDSKVTHWQYLPKAPEGELTRG